MFPDEEMTLLKRKKRAIKTIQNDYAGILNALLPIKRIINSSPVHGIHTEGTLLKPPEQQLPCPGFINPSLAWDQINPENQETGHHRTGGFPF